MKPTDVVHKIGDEYVAVLAPNNPGSNGPLCVDFRLIAVLGVQSDGTVLYQRNGAVSSPDPVESLDDAEAVAHGFVKWDGCTQYDTDIHVDSQKQHDALLHALAQTRALALAEMPAAEDG